jgi:hypothetical protein
MIRAFNPIPRFEGDPISRRRLHRFFPSVAESASRLEDRALLSGAGAGMAHHAAVAHGNAVANHRLAATREHHHGKVSARHLLQAPGTITAINVNVSGRSSTSRTGGRTGTLRSGVIDPIKLSVAPIMYTATVRQVPRGLAISRAFAPSAGPGGTIVVIQPATPAITRTTTTTPATTTSASTSSTGTTTIGTPTPLTFSPLTFSPLAFTPLVFPTGPANLSPMPLNGTLPFTGTPANPSPLPLNGTLPFTGTPANPSPLPLNGTLPFTGTPANPSPVAVTGTLF